MVESPGYVAMTAQRRRATVAIFTEILAAWWQRHTNTPPVEADRSESSAPAPGSAG